MQGANSMNIIAEVTEGGVLRIKSPELKPGDQICLQTRPLPDQENKGKWSEIKRLWNWQTRWISLAGPMKKSFVLFMSREVNS